MFPISGAGLAGITEKIDKVSGSPSPPSRSAAAAHSEPRDHLSTIAMMPLQVPVTGACAPSSRYFGTVKWNIVPGVPLATAQSRPRRGLHSTANRDAPFSGLGSVSLDFPLIQRGNRQVEFGPRPLYRFPELTETWQSIPVERVGRLTFSSKA
jgi:hypothetical protein